MAFLIRTLEFHLVGSSHTVVRQNRLLKWRRIISPENLIDYFNNSDFFVIKISSLSCEIARNKFVQDIYFIIQLIDDIEKFTELL